METRSQFLCYPCEVASCERITGLCSDLQFVFCRHELTYCDPRAKKTGPRSASQADSVASECASSEVSIPLGGEATTFRKILLTQLEEVMTNERKVDNGAVMRETKQEEALSKLPDVPVPMEAMTELGVKTSERTWTCTWLPSRYFFLRNRLIGEEGVDGVCKRIESA